MDKKRIELPLHREDIRTLRAGEAVSLYGAAYMACNAAHKRLEELIKRDGQSPLDLFGASFYYASLKPGGVPGSPITSERLDAFTPLLIRKGLTAMIGRGSRINAVQKAMKNRAVYFAFTGVPADIGRCILETEIIALEELGPEAIRRIHFLGLPAIVAVDAFGGVAENLTT